MLRTAIGATAMTFVVYGVFINLMVMLPRGIGIFRNFHLFMEHIVRL
ncbi:hypothetical protein LJC31_06110 [Synergistaceae bacterium OttesenSCG-928-I11]|nr:hypothetical protein [Synergistaceae bacterium OttesenSCG-928-I11]